MKTVRMSSDVLKFDKIIDQSFDEPCKDNRVTTIENSTLNLSEEQKRSLEITADLAFITASQKDEVRKVAFTRKAFFLKKVKKKYGQL